MDYKQRAYPIFSACGLNCGLCPRYQMEGKSKCPGCSGKDFLSKHPKCGVLSCSQREGYEYCFQCNAFPCSKYDGADSKDSFITHLHQLSDMEKAKNLGIDAYIDELDEKIDILEELLKSYNDGRQKSLFCLAINLLDIDDVRQIMKQIHNEVKLDNQPKEKAVHVTSILQSMSMQRNIELKLRK